MSGEFEDSRSNRKIKFLFDNKYWDNPQIFESVTLYQIGDLSCDGGMVIGDHIQSCYEISYIVSGKGLYVNQGRQYAVEEGDVFLCLPGEQHDGFADMIDPFRYFYVGFMFDANLVEDNFLIHIKKMFDQSRSPITKDKFGIKAPFVNILNELINLKKYSTFMIKTYLYQIVVLTYRNIFEGWQKEYEPENSYDEKAKIVYEVINFIDLNLCRIVDLTSIADVLGYSYSHLSHIFSKEIGITIKDYYNQERFKKAIELLNDTDYSITAIARMLQYHTIHTFSKAFRNNFGISPTEYQAIHRTIIEDGIEQKKT